MGQSWSLSYVERHDPVDILFVGLDNSGKTSIINRLAGFPVSSTQCGSRWPTRKPRQQTGQVSSVDERPAYVEDEAEAVTPTVGIDVKPLVVGRHCVVAFDMSGQGRYRSLWSYYFRQCDAIVFVVDSADQSRLPVVRDKLFALLINRKLNSRRTRVPLLILANKSDKAEAVGDDVLTMYLRLTEVEVGRPLKVVACSAVNGTGLGSGFEWLIGEVENCWNSREQQERSDFVTWL